MIGLNLLSSAQKRALRLRVLYALIERLMLALLFTVLFASIMLMLVRVRLSKNLAAIQGRQILSAEYVSVNENVRALDQQVARVEALQRMAVSPSSLLLDIAARTPPGIAIASLSFDVAGAKLDMHGIAARREDLLAYEEALKQSPLVKQLESPISNLFRKTDVNFQFAIQLNAEEMKKAYAPAP